MKTMIVILAVAQIAMFGWVLDLRNLVARLERKVEGGRRRGDN